MPKTNGELRIHIRHDDEGDAHGLFVHGFKPGSKAEQQGLMRAGDEILTVDGVDVEGKFLESLVAVLQAHEGADDSVRMRLRRRAPGAAGPLVKSARRTSRSAYNTSHRSPRLEIAKTPVAVEDDEQLSTLSKFQITDYSPSKRRPKRSPTADKTAASQSPSDDEQSAATEAAATEGEEAEQGEEGDDDNADISLDDLDALPYEDLFAYIPKTNGELRIYIRHDDEGERHGLFVHGFKPGSKAERQGFIRVGDEIIMINEVDVSGE